mgnify:CR=1 FL=1
MTKKLAVFDFDSTLMDGETIEIIASELGLQEEVAKITSQAMEGLSLIHISEPTRH